MTRCVQGCCWQLSSLPWCCQMSICRADLTDQSASGQCLPSASLFLLIFPSLTLNSTSATHWVYEGCQQSSLLVSSFSFKFICTYSPIFSPVQFSQVAQSCLTLCDPMGRSTPGLRVCHQPLEFTQTHFHGVIDAIQPSHPLSLPSPPALNLSQHQGLFK